MAHFYDSEGVLHDRVPYADPTKGNRDATLADARKYGWNPSVTTVLGDLNKPQLNDWRVMEAIKVALPYANIDTTEQVLQRVKRESEAYRDWSADFGSEVHRLVSLGITGLREPLYSDMGLVGALDVAQAFLDWMGPNGLQVTESEISFCSSLGYGGTIDLLGTYCGEPFIGDLKTQDWGAQGDKNKRANWYDPEWPLQLAGYDIGHRDVYFKDGQSFYGGMQVAYEQERLLRLSFVLSRTRPGLIEVKQWETPERYDAAWLSLFDYWCAVHRWGKYSPKPGLELLQGGLSLED